MSVVTRQVAVVTSSAVGVETHLLNAGKRGGGDAKERAEQALGKQPTEGASRRARNEAFAQGFEGEPTPAGPEGGPDPEFPVTFDAAGEQEVGDVEGRPSAGPRPRRRKQQEGWAHRFDQILQGG